MKLFSSTCDRIVVDRDYVVSILEDLKPDSSGFVDLKAISRMSNVRYQGVWTCTQRLADVLGLTDHQMLAVRAYIVRINPAEAALAEKHLMAASLTPAEETVARRFAQWIRKEGDEARNKAFFCSNLNDGKCFVATSRR